MATFEATRPTVGAQAIGIARAAYEYALDYAKEREQFGRPIIENQAIAFTLADMKLEIDAARLLVWRASWMGRTGKPFTAAEGSMSKLKAGEVAVWATERAIQILGGNGYTREYPVERMAPRREDLHDLRGHLGDPAARHRARDHRAQDLVGAASGPAPPRGGPGAAVPSRPPWSGSVRGARTCAAPPGSPVLCATVLGLAACGGGDDSGGVPASRRGGGLGRDGARARSPRRAPRCGRRSRATARATARPPEEQVSEAYVSHFEEVEGPLEAKDPALKERLEEAIGTELRDRDEAEGPRGEVERGRRGDRRGPRQGGGRAAMSALARRVAVLALVLAAALRRRARRPAGGDQLAQGRHEMTLARARSSAALEAVKAGDRDRAYKLARSAYLDHFEFVEVPLRLRNPNLVLDTEFTFAELRNEIRDGASVATVRATRVDAARGSCSTSTASWRQGRRRAARSRSASRSRSSSARASRRCC